MKAKPDATKKPRLVWYGTTKASWYIIPLNEVTLTEEEAEMSFAYMARCNSKYAS